MLTCISLTHMLKVKLMAGFGVRNEFSCGLDWPRPDASGTGSPKNPIAPWFSPDRGALSRIHLLGSSKMNWSSHLLALQGPQTLGSPPSFLFLSVPKNSLVSCRLHILQENWLIWILSWGVWLDKFIWKDYQMSCVLSVVAGYLWHKHIFMEFAVRVQRSLLGPVLQKPSVNGWANWRGREHPEIIGKSRNLWAWEHSLSVCNVQLCLDPAKRLQSCQIGLCN